jgi:hypothetical protein
MNTDGQLGQLVEGGVVEYLKVQYSGPHSAIRLRH